MPVFFCLVSSEEGQHASKGNNVQLFVKWGLTVSRKTKVYMCYFPSLPFSYTFPQASASICK